MRLKYSIFLNLFTTFFVFCLSSHSAYAASIVDNPISLLFYDYWVLIILVGIVVILAPDFLFKSELGVVPIIVAIVWVISIAVIRYIIA
jgi:ABC-type glycerol-3-phosphate transport system permease component